MCNREDRLERTLRRTPAERKKGISHRLRRAVVSAAVCQSSSTLESAGRFGMTGPSRCSILAPEYFFLPICPVIDYAMPASAERSTQRLLENLKPLAANQNGSFASDENSFWDSSTSGSAGPTKFSCAKTLCGGRVLPASGKWRSTQHFQERVRPKSS